MNLKDLESYVIENNIIIPDKCWQSFLSFFGSQVVALKSVCIDVRLIQNQYANDTQACLKSHLPYNDLLKKIHDLNPYKHGFFNAPLTEMYLVLAYIAYIRKDKEKLYTIMLSFAAYMLVTMYRKYFAKGCNIEVMQMMLHSLHTKAIYKKHNLDHVEIIKHVVGYAMKRHTDADDVIFRWMRNIKAHINQLMKTLAQTYYKHIKQLKDNRITGNVTQTSVESFLFLYKEALVQAMESLPRLLKSTSSISINDEIVECLMNSLDPQQLYQWFVDILSRNPQLKMVLLDPDSCNSYKSIYMKFANVLKTFAPLNVWLSTKVCDVTEPNAIKIIALIFVFAWKLTFCNNR